MKRLAAIALAVAAFAARAATTNEVDVAALVAAVDAGLSETNGWILSGLGKYAKGADYSSNIACIKFDTKGDLLESPDFGAHILGVELVVRCSATDNSTRFLYFRDMDGADAGVVATCSQANRCENKTLAFSVHADFSQFRIVLDGSSNTGVWGIGAMSVITADPVAAPTGLRVTRNGGDWCSLAWENGDGTVSNRIDTFFVDRGAGEEVLLETGFDDFSAVGKGNPVPCAAKLPGIDPSLSGENVYAPTNTSGICQVGKGDALGFLRYDGIGDYSNVVLRLRAKHYPGDNAETTVISVDSSGATNEVETIVLGDDYADYEIGLSSVTNAGSALLIGYYKTKSNRNRRVLIDSLSIVRTNADRRNLLETRWIPAAPGAASFSTKDHEIVLVPKSEYRFEVRAQNADGLISDPAAVDVVLDSPPGFRFILR